MTTRSIGFLASISFAACGIGACSNGFAPGAVPAQSQTATGSLSIRVRVPARAHSARRKSANYISKATAGIAIAIAGPTRVNKVASLLPSGTGCTAGSAGTTCTLTIPSLKPCATAANCYTASIATYDAVSGCPVACSVAGAKELSANQNLPFRIAKGRSNAIRITLDGVPVALAVVPAAGSSLSGSVGSGFALSKCGSDGVSVFGVDADGNDILGAGAPVPSLVSDDTSKLSVSTPPPSNPNLFTIVRPSPPPNAHTTVHLTAGATPLAGASPAPAVTTAPIPMTFNGDICGVITEFSRLDSPNFITSGPDGNIWYTIYNPANVAKMTTSGTLVQEYPVSTITGLASIISGPNNELWFVGIGVGFGTPGIGSVTTSGTVAVYPLPSSNPTPIPAGIATGPDGNLWFVECNAKNIVQMKPDGTILNTFPTGSGAQPFRIKAGPDGRLWFTEGSQLGAITTGGVISQYTPAGVTGATEITVGPDGALWFSDTSNGEIGRIDTTGSTTTEYPIPTASSFPTAIVAGPDGALWFIEEGAKKIGRITTSGMVTNEYPVSGAKANDLVNMTLGPDGALWFVETASLKIGRLQ
ncbi:MAG: hypothetical protein JO029_14855 [Candidatus Eremiobacteraeota bacterium]|nr:hypothetical protein [Candidatus Eremiobacteraeota bacterium]